MGLQRHGAAIIILACVSNLPCIYAPSHEKPSSNEVQPVEKLEIIGETEPINTQLKKIASATFSTKNNGEGTTETLKGCFGALGHWLSLTSSRKNDPAKQRLCYCECYKKLSKEGSIGLPKKQAAELRKCCSHVKAEGCDGCIDQGTTGRKVEMVGGSAGDLRESTLRLTSGLSEGRHVTIRDLGQDASAGNVQHNSGRGSMRLKSGIRRTPKNVSRKGEQCCCEKCCENCFMRCHFFCCGLPLICLIKTCQCTCDHLFRCLVKYCNC